MTPATYDVAENAIAVIPMMEFSKKVSARNDEGLSYTTGIRRGLLGTSPKFAELLDIPSSSLTFT